MITVINEGKRAVAIAAKAPSTQRCIIAAGEKLELQDYFLADAASKGLNVATGGTTISQAANEQKNPQPDPTVTVDEIVDAIKLVMMTGDNSKLTGGGSPRVKAVEEILGQDITRGQLDEAWDTYQDEVAD
jgi:hypothetical protein